MTKLAVVHKRVLLGSEIIRLPMYSEIQGFAAQGDNLCMWYTTPMTVSDLYEEWQLVVVGTGHPYESDFDYLAGPALVDGFVFHLVGKYLGSGKN